MEDRTIWHYALRDIISANPILQPHLLLLMSSQELRHRATKIHRLHSLWYHDGRLEPKRVRSHHFDPIERCTQVLFIPGGEWILAQLLDTTMLLYQVQILEKPIVIVPPVDLDYRIRSRLTISISSRQKVRAVCV